MHFTKTKGRAGPGSDNPGRSGISDQRNCFGLSRGYNQLRVRIAFFFSCALITNDEKGFLIQVLSIKLSEMPRCLRLAE